MPETLEGLWKQRLRWAMVAQVLIKNLDVIKSPIHNHLWPLMLELCLKLVVVVCHAYYVCFVVTQFYITIKTYLL